jgi:hypothetical protein
MDSSREPSGAWADFSCSARTFLHSPGAVPRATFVSFTIHPGDTMWRVRVSPRLSLAIVALAGSGCASSNNSNGQDIVHIVPDAQRSPNVITAYEIENSGTTTALAAIQRLRPNFLVVHGQVNRRTGDQGIIVYSNGTRIGDTSALSNIPAGDVKTIEYLSGNDATQRFGAGHTHGAILVTRK